MLIGFSAFGGINVAEFFGGIFKRNFEVFPQKVLINSLLTVLPWCRRHVGRNFLRAVFSRPQKIAEKFRLKNTALWDFEMKEISQN